MKLVVKKLNVRQCIEEPSSGRVAWREEAPGCVGSGNLVKTQKEAIINYPFTGLKYRARANVCETLLL